MNPPKKSFFIKISTGDWIAMSTFVLGVLVTILVVFTSPCVNERVSTARYYFNVKPYSHDPNTKNVVKESFNFYINLKPSDKIVKNPDRYKPFHFDIRGQHKYQVLGIENIDSKRDSAQYRFKEELISKNIKNIKSGQFPLLPTKFHFHRILHYNPHTKLQHVFFTTPVDELGSQKNLLVIVEPDIVQYGIVDPAKFVRWMRDNILNWRLSDIKSIETEYFTKSRQDELEKSSNLVFPNFKLDHISTNPESTSVEKEKLLAANVDTLASMLRSMAIATLCAGIENNEMKIMYFLDQGIETNFDTERLSFCSVSKLNSDSDKDIFSAINESAQIVKPIVSKYVLATKAYYERNLDKSQKETKIFLRNILSYVDNENQLTSFQIDPTNWQSALNYAAIAKYLPSQSSLRIFTRLLTESKQKFVGNSDTSGECITNETFVDSVLSNIEKNEDSLQNVINLENLVKIFIPIPGEDNQIRNATELGDSAKINLIEKSRKISEGYDKIEQQNLLPHLKYSEFWLSAYQDNVDYFDESFWVTVREEPNLLYEEFYFELATKLKNEEKTEEIQKLIEITSETEINEKLNNYLNKLPVEQAEMKRRWKNLIKLL